MARKVQQMRGKGNHTGLVPVPSRSRSILPDLATQGRLGELADGKHEVADSVGGARPPVNSCRFGCCRRVRFEHRPERPCACGCGCILPPGGKAVYASAACRMRGWRVSRG